jgi:hypothetical protein
MYFGPRKFVEVNKKANPVADGRNVLRMQYYFAPVTPRPSSHPTASSAIAPPAFDCVGDDTD